MTQPPVLYFPDLPFYAFSTHKEPTFSSKVSTHASGKEALAIMRVYPVWEFELKFDVLRDQTPNATADPFRVPYTELQQLGGLYLACKAQYGRFLFDDPTDDSRTDSPFGTGDGSTTTFAVTRTFGTYTEPVGALSSVSAVYINGVEQSPESYGWGPPTAYAGNTFLGNTIRFNTPPLAGSTLTADFAFYFLCRFTDDQQDFEEFMFNLWRTNSLKFRSVKV